MIQKKNPKRKRRRRRRRRRSFSVDTIGWEECMYLTKLSGQWGTSFRRIRLGSGNPTSGPAL